MHTLEGRRLLSVMMVLMLVAVVGAALVSASPVQANEGPYYVSATGNDANDGSASDNAHAWLTIQHAVDNVTAGDTIMVAAGTYTENVNVNKSLTLTGASSATVIVNASAHTNWPVFSVNASSVNISGFRLTGAIDVSTTEAPFFETTAGITLGDNVANCNISNNILTGNYNGIRLNSGSHNNTFTSNDASSNINEGFELYHSDNNTFTSNTANLNTKYGFKMETASHNTFTGNIANSNTKYGFFLAAGTPTGSPPGCLYNTFTNNTANLNTEYGIRIDNGDHNTLTGNTFNANVVAGIRLKEVLTNLTVNNNNITNNPIGIDIATIATNVTTWTVTKNNISGNTIYGVSNLGTGTLNAERNWWGDNSGPSGGVADPLTGSIANGSGDAVSANVHFDPWQGKSTPGSTSSATGTGTVTFTPSNGSITGLTAVAEGTLPVAGKPGVSFPHGLFSFNIIGLAPGSTVTITITFPLPVPVGTQYWKCQGGTWINCTSLLGDDDGDNVLTLTLTDGGLGDADGAANGVIVDPGGPAVAVGAPAPAKPRASATPPRPLNPAQMSAQYLSVNPQQASANQPVTITTNVVNTGDEGGNYNVALKINGQVEQSRMVSVGPQGTQPVKFTVARAEPGTYTVDIGGQKGSFTVLGASSSGTTGSKTGALIALALIGILIIATLVVLFLRRT
jgi:parallel beta-helix repeat protein